MEEQKLKPKAFIGIDPGKTGSAALITAEGTHEILDYPGDPSLIVDTFREWILNHEIIMAALEKVGARARGCFHVHLWSEPGSLGGNHIRFLHPFHDADPTTMAERNHRSKGRRGPKNQILEHRQASFP